MQFQSQNSAVAAGVVLPTQGQCCLATLDPVAMRQKRYKGLRGLRRLSIVMMAVSSIGLVCGILTFVFAAPNLKFPFSWGGDTIPSILVFISGLLGFLAAKDGLKEEVPSGKVKCRIIGQYALAVTAITFSFLGMGYAIWALTVCMAKKEDCHPNKKENTIMAVFNIILGLIMGILCILGTCFFCCYGRTFGFRSRWQRTMDMQVQLLQAQLALQQAQAQRQAQGDAPPPYPGYEQSQPYQAQPSTGFSYGTQYNTVPNKY